VPVVEERERADLRAGFGWCRMPNHLVETDLEEGGLVELKLDDDAF
jgi:hypothetical protein